MVFSFFHGTRSPRPRECVPSLEYCAPRFDTPKVQPQCYPQAGRHDTSIRCKPFDQYAAMN